MKFITYAQNFEDVLLWRALGHVKEGFYIDVGANDPVEHSVTRAFYDAGWHGISIEPLPAYRHAFIAQRSRDINLAMAAGAADGELTLYDVPAVRGWASPERDVAAAHEAQGYQVAAITVPVRTLSSICAEHVPAGSEIHFLKIDVEGFEGEVLRGMDFARWRPWILVIEATLPDSRVTNHATWEHIVTGQRYRFVWFDGLNRYYVAEEHSELADAFTVPPNVFDNFISYHLSEAWAAGKALTKALRESESHSAAVEIEMHDAMQRSQYLEEQLAEAHQHAHELDQQVAQTLARAHAAETELAQSREALAAAHLANHETSVWARGLEERLLAMLASSSWRVTAPLRWAGKLVHRVRQPGLARRVLSRITANEKLRRALIPVLLRYPTLGKQVSASLAAIKQVAPPAPQGIDVPEELRALPASVRAVLADLQRARNNHTGS
jgi:FkbM family methyltransferase